MKLFDEEVGSEDEDAAAFDVVVDVDDVGMGPAVNAWSLARRLL